MKIRTSILCTLLVFSSFAQKSQAPKLVVGIVVDQMMYEYLYRYQSRFSKGGFRLMMDKGTNCSNTRYNYVPTYTGPGHASIYTGATPSSHGIVGNEWYDRSLSETVNCVTDTNFYTVGSDSKEGDRSPKSLYCATITDQLKMTYPNGKVISISIKDRSAILPGGHLSDGSYWYDKKTGNMVTSTFYSKELASWVNQFNEVRIPSSSMQKEWNTLFPIETYTASGPDDSPYEQLLAGKEKPVFPYNFSAVSEKDAYNFFTATPWANTFLTDFALSALTNEKLGRDEVTDFLAISYSTPDIAGHSFGPRSVEIEDMYLRLDLELQRLFNELNKKVGKDWVVFLTADHAVVQVPQMLKDNQLPGGYFFSNQVMTDLEDLMKVEFGANLILTNENHNIYLNEELIQFLQLDQNQVEKQIASYLQGFPEIGQVYTSRQLENLSVMENQDQMIKKGYHTSRSGNIVYTLKPGYLQKSKDSEAARRGTSHGSPYGYDTHVPLLWYGQNIPAQQVMTPYEITDIVPTLMHILRVSSPPCAEGKTIVEIWK